jgi:hypothetical protein
VQCRINKHVTVKSTFRKACAFRLTDIRKLQAAEKRRGPYERRVHASLRVFERYQTPAEAEALAQGIFFEQQLRTRIDDLKALRRMGARTFVQGEMLQARCCSIRQTICIIRWPLRSPFCLLFACGASALAWHATCVHLQLTLAHKLSGVAAPSKRCLAMCRRSASAKRRWQPAVPAAALSATAAAPRPCPPRRSRRRSLRSPPPLQLQAPCTWALDRTTASQLRCRRGGGGGRARWTCRRCQACRHSVTRSARWGPASNRCRVLCLLHLGVWRRSYPCATACQVLVVFTMRHGFCGGVCVPHSPCDLQSDQH